MASNVSQKLIAAHLVDGEARPGATVSLGIDQTLTQDATGTLVMLSLEAMQLDRARTEVSVQYVDHNLIQQDHRNPDDHLFLESAAKRFGLWYSRPGNGVSHPLHMHYFGKPGKTLLGSDSHTPAAGALGMLAFGAGGLDVAMAIAGEPYSVTMPEIWGVELTGQLPDWVSAKDVILELLRRHGVDGGRGRIIEYCGPGLARLTAMDRHVIANMGTELGATSTVFPADDQVRRFLEHCRRADDFTEILADDGAGYDVEETMDLSRLEPLIAKPSSPGNVVPVASLAGEPIYQAYIGSSANPGFRDFAVPAMVLAARGAAVPAHISLDINPASTDVIEGLVRSDLLVPLLRGGARLHQPGCNGCIGMGQAPATGRNSLRTVPRNFPGRSGTVEDSVFLCSPETAIASAIRGEITDPRTLDIAYPALPDGWHPTVNAKMFAPPPPPDRSAEVELVKGPNVSTLPDLPALDDDLELPILLALGDDISTDEILPAGAEILPYRSNIEAISEFVFHEVDGDYVARATDARDPVGHAILAGRNYGQGSSREHAALAPRFLGLRAVVAKSFARIHLQNLVNYGVLALIVRDDRDHDALSQGKTLVLSGLGAALDGAEDIRAEIKDGDQAATTVTLQLPPSDRDRAVLRAGGLTNWFKDK